MQREYEIKKTRGEGNDHYRGRMILNHYLKLIFRDEIKSSCRTSVLSKYPIFKPLVKSDGAVVAWDLPKPKIRIWVEIQDSHIDERGWVEKLKPIMSYLPEQVFIALTRNLQGDVGLVRRALKALHKAKSHARIFVVGPQEGELYAVPDAGFQKLVFKDRDC